MTRLRTGAALAAMTLPLVAVGLGALAGPAAADARAVSDAVDDRYPAALDITGFTVHNGATTFKATIRMRKVEPDLITVSAVLYPASGAIYVVGTRAGKKGSRPAFIELADGQTQVDCPGLKVAVDTRHDEVRVALPQTCLGADAGTLRVRALSEKGTGDQDATKRLTVDRS